MENEKKLTQITDKRKLTLAAWDMYLTLLLAKETREATIKKLKEKNLLNERNSKNETFLIAACYLEDPSLAKRLVEEGAEINIIYEERTPIFMAIEDNRTEFLEYLLDNGGDANFPSDPSPLNFLARQKTFPKDHLKMMDLLLAKKADHTLVTKIDGYIPLIALVGYYPIKTTLPLVKKLLERYQNLQKELTDSQKYTLFDAFFKANSANKKTKEIKEFYALLQSKHFFYFDSLWNLLKSVIDKDNHFHLTQILLYDSHKLWRISEEKKRVQLNLMQYAMRNRKKEQIVLSLMNEYKSEHLNDLCGIEYNCLHLAIIFNYSINLISTMIDKDMDVSLTTAENKPPFKKKLDKKNIATEILNMHRNTALHLAFIRTNVDERLEMIKKLLPKSNLLLQNEEGFTSLHFACIYGDEKSIETLVLAAKEKGYYSEYLEKINIFGESAMKIVQFNQSKISLSKFKQIEQLLSPNANEKQEKTEMSTHQLTNLSQGDKVQSGRSYAMEIMTSEEYAQYQLTEPEEDDLPSDNNNHHKEPLPADTTWLDKRIALSEVEEIKRKGSPYCFSYIYPESIEECSAEEQKKFKQLACQFSPLKGGIGLKDVKGNYTTYIQYGDVVKEVQISYKIKISEAARLYMVKLPADKKSRGTLYFGLFYVSANKHDRKNILATKKNKTHLIK